MTRKPLLCSSCCCMVDELLSKSHNSPIRLELKITQQCLDSVLVTRNYSKLNERVEESPQELL